MEGWGGTGERVWSPWDVACLEVELRRAEEALVGIGGRKSKKRAPRRKLVRFVPLMAPGLVGGQAAAEYKGCGRHLDAG